MFSCERVRRKKEIQDSIVRDETAVNDARPKHKQPETGPTNGVKERVGIVQAEVYADEFKASNGAAADGVDERCPVTRGKSHAIRVVVA